MKRAILSAVILTASAGLALSAEVAPDDLTFTDGGAVEQSLTGVPGDAAAGRVAMSSKSIGNCVSCHVISEMADIPFQGNVGPTLDGVADRWSEAEIRGIVANAKKTYEGTVMPAFYKVSGFIRPGDGYTAKAANPETFGPLLTAQQVEDVVAYLMTLKE